MIGRVFATLKRIKDHQGAGLDVIEDVKIAMWLEPAQYQEGHAVLLEIQSQDRVALWEALESVVERDARFAWIRGYPGIKEILERRQRNEMAQSFLVFSS